MYVKLFQQFGKRAKRSFPRCGRNQMGNDRSWHYRKEQIILVIKYDARSKDLEGMLWKSEKVDCLYDATTEGLVGVHDDERGTINGMLLFRFGDLCMLPNCNPVGETKSLAVGFRFWKLVEVKVDKTLCFAKEPMIKRGPGLPLGTQGQMRSKCPPLFVDSAMPVYSYNLGTDFSQDGDTVTTRTRAIIREVFVKLLLKSSGKLSIRLCGRMCVIIEIVVLESQMDEVIYVSMVSRPSTIWARKMLFVKSWSMKKNVAWLGPTSVKRGREWFILAIEEVYMIKYSIHPEEMQHMVVFRFSIGGPRMKKNIAVAVVKYLAYSRVEVDGSMVIRMMLHNLSYPSISEKG
ncbi:hypothetical protein Tco_0973280 [Tanacetum coccineum]